MPEETVKQVDAAVRGVAAMLEKAAASASPGSVEGVSKAFRNFAEGVALLVGQVKDVAQENG